MLVFAMDMQGMHLTDLAVAVSRASVVYVSIDVIDWAVVFSSVDKAKAGPSREDVGLNKD
jgi:hypothetical protein